MIKDQMVIELCEHVIDGTHKPEERKTTSTVALPKKILLLDPKRQHNAGIAIARLRMPASEIKQAILTLDSSKLGKLMCQYWKHVDHGAMMLSC